MVDEGGWDEQRLREKIPEDLAMNILENIKAPTLHEDLDNVVWILETRGKFSVKSSWEYIRKRKDTSIVYKNMWVKGLPFKISFFMWNVWKAKLPLDETLKRWGVTLCHRNAGADQIRMRKHWDMSSSDLLQPLRWLDLLNMLKHYTPKLEVHKVIWEFSIEEWLKVNTDGASRGNPGRSSIGFCMRNELGYVVYACGKEVQETTNTIVEAMAMVEALRYCSQHNITQFCLQTYSMMLKKYGNHLG
ncbi:uncharacterized protein LOC142164034 [Nicotiana tabacum]|uniref:Uncharacterized protein LOC142164034 n=1 Tax=Nicotiana tabacum TaxID=4097 RepID=A0AC58RX19_TOBAC